jgi:hypothetical protein
LAEKEKWDEVINFMRKNPKILLKILPSPADQVEDGILKGADLSPLRSKTKAKL